MHDQIQYHPIGVIRSPFTDPVGMPIQPAGAQGVVGKVEIHPEYVPGLEDLESFSHIILLYHFHLSKGYRLTAKPYMDDEPHGIFAIRAPNRPNPIGLSVVRLIKVEGASLEIEGVDIVDGTPLLDIKPFVPAFDVPQVESVGWLEKSGDRVRSRRSDARFT